MTKPWLADRLRLLADRDRLASNHPLRIAAGELHVALLDPQSTGYDVRRCADNARDAWCVYTGERIDEALR